MKPSLLISLVCFGMFSDAFAQKNSPVTRGGQITNTNSSVSNRLVDAVPNTKFSMPGSKPRVILNEARTLFYESFDNVPGYVNHGNRTYNFPNGWLRFNVDGRSPGGGTTYVNEAWIRREDFNFATSDSVAFSTSWTVPAGRGDDWMWTPLITNISTTTNLHWNAVAYDPDFRDGYEVRIMRAADGPPTGGVNNIGNQLTKSTQVFSVAEEATNWTSHTISLGAYAKDAIYIGFRNNSDDKFLLLIDDVLVDDAETHDLATLQPNRVSEYSSIPLSETRALNFETSLTNMGTIAVGQARLQVQITRQSENLVFLLSQPFEILAGASKLYTINGVYTPKSLGVHSFSFSHSFENPDLNPANDIKYAESLRISANTFSRITGTLIDSISVGAGPGQNCLVGTIFTLNATEKLRGILAGISPEAGKKVKARIYTTTNGIPNNALTPLWESAEITFTGSETPSTFSLAQLCLH